MTKREKKTDTYSYLNENHKQCTYNSEHHHSIIKINNWLRDLLLSLTFLVFAPCHCFLQATPQLKVLQFQSTKLLCMVTCNTQQ